MVRPTRLYNSASRCCWLPTMPIQSASFKVSPLPQPSPQPCGLILLFPTPNQLRKINTNFFN
jgi:hypothetical protein